MKGDDTMKLYTIRVEKSGDATIFDNDTDEEIITCESEDAAVEYVEVEMGLPGILADYDIVYAR